MKKANIALGCIGICLGIVVIAAAAGFPENRSAVDPGAAYFPTLMAILLIVLCLALIVRSLMGKGVDVNEEILITAGWKRMGLGLLLFAAYCPLFVPLGFIVDSTLLIFLGMLLLENRKYVQMALISVGMSVVIYLLFARVLGAQLPAGILGLIL